MQRIKLWQFNLAILLVSLILFGVEGIGVWAVGGGTAWALNRHNTTGRLRYGVALCVWAALMFGLHQGRR